MTRTILITGAAGNIGAKLADHFRQTNACEFRLIDQRPGEGITAADLADYSGVWPQRFEGVDTVIHMAGEPRGTATWAQVRSANIIGTQHVLRAAREAKVRRVVFASTNQVMLGYRFRDDVNPVTTDLPPMPLSPYGVSKLFCEEIGRAFTEETGIDFLALRIGYFQRGENVPGPHMGIGVWGQQMWLSNRDMMQALERSIEAPRFGFAIVNLMSNNPGMRWDLGHTRDVIGYVPQDGHATVVDDKLRDEDVRARATALPPGTWYNEYFDPVTG